MKTPILGSSYTARSVNAADSQMINLFPEIVPEGGKEPAFLSRCPGLRLLVTVGTGPIRGIRTVGDYLYVVSGNSLYRVDDSYTVTLLGVVNDIASPVSMSDNGTQVVVACDGPMYVYNTLTNVFAQVTDPDFPGALTISFLDGYFVFIEPSSQKVWVTALNDPLSVDPLDFASAEADPDNLVSSIVDHGQLGCLAPTRLRSGTTRATLTSRFSALTAHSTRSDALPHSRLPRWTTACSGLGLIAGARVSSTGPTATRALGSAPTPSSGKFNNIPTFLTL
jgi:hypothetical protein